MRTAPTNWPGDESKPTQKQGDEQSPNCDFHVKPSQNTTHVGPAHGGGGAELLDWFDAETLDDELELGFELADELNKELEDDDCEELLSELEAEIDGPRVGSVGAGLPVNGWAAWKSGICGAPLQIRFKSVSCW